MAQTDPRRLPPIRHLETRRLTVLAIFAAMSVSLFSVSCTEADFTAQAALDDGFRKDLDQLRGKRIFFGHQSVGRNVMAGMFTLLEEAGEKDFRVVNADSAPGEILGPSRLVHSRLGSNGHPATKCEGFAAFLADTTSHYDAAVLKFCYVDVQDSTDVDAMVDAYRKSIAAIRAGRPDLAIVHATVPLKAGSDGWRLKLKRLLGREDWADQDNTRRDEFNRKIKAAFPGEIFWDIAAVESTLPDGGRQSFQRGGETRYSLLPSLTYDGGHLNATGSRMAAKALAHALAMSMARRN